MKRKARINSYSDQCASNPPFTYFTYIHRNGHQCVDDGQTLQVLQGIALLRRDATLGQTLCQGLNKDQANLAHP